MPDHKEFADKIGLPAKLAKFTPELPFTQAAHNAASKVDNRAAGLGVGGVGVGGAGGVGAYQLLKRVGGTKGKLLAGLAGIAGVTGGVGMGIAAHKTHRGANIARAMVNSGERFARGMAPDEKEVELLRSADLDDFELAQPIIRAGLNGRNKTGSIVGVLGESRTQEKVAGITAPMLIAAGAKPHLQEEKQRGQMIGAGSLLGGSGGLAAGMYAAKKLPGKAKLLKSLAVGAGILGGGGALYGREEAQDASRSLAMANMMLGNAPTQDHMGILMDSSPEELRDAAKHMIDMSQMGKTAGLDKEAGLYNTLDIDSQTGATKDAILRRIASLTAQEKALEVQRPILRATLPPTEAMRRMRAGSSEYIGDLGTHFDVMRAMERPLRGGTPPSGVINALKDNPELAAPGLAVAGVGAAGAVIASRRAKAIQAARRAKAIGVIKGVGRAGKVGLIGAGVLGAGAMIGNAFSKDDPEKTGGWLEDTVNTVQSNLKPVATKVKKGMEPGARAFAEEYILPNMSATNNVKYYADKHKTPLAVGAGVLGVGAAGAGIAAVSAKRRAAAAAAARAAKLTRYGKAGVIGAGVLGAIGLASKTYVNSDPEASHRARVIKDMISADKVHSKGGGNYKDNMVSSMLASDKKHKQAGLDKLALNAASYGAGNGLHNSPSGTAQAGKVLRSVNSVASKSRKKATAYASDAAVKGGDALSNLSTWIADKFDSASDSGWSNGATLGSKVRGKSISGAWNSAKASRLGYDNQRIDSAARTLGNKELAVRPGTKKDPGTLWPLGDQHGPARKPKGEPLVFAKGPTLKSTVRGVAPDKALLTAEKNRRIAINTRSARQFGPRTAAPSAFKNKNIGASAIDSAQGIAGDAHRAIVANPNAAAAAGAGVAGAGAIGAAAIVAARKRAAAKAAAATAARAAKFTRYGKAGLIGAGILGGASLLRGSGDKEKAAVLNQSVMPGKLIGNQSPMYKKTRDLTPFSPGNGVGKKMYDVVGDVEQKAQPAINAAKEWGGKAVNYAKDNPGTAAAVGGVAGAGALGAGAVAVARKRAAAKAAAATAARAAKFSRYGKLGLIGAGVVGAGALLKNTLSGDRDKQSSVNFTDAAASPHTKDALSKTARSVAESIINAAPTPKLPDGVASTALGPLTGGLSTGLGPMHSIRRALTNPGKWVLEGGKWLGDGIGTLAADAQYAVTPNPAGWIRKVPEDPSSTGAILGTLGIGAAGIGTAAAVGSRRRAQAEALAAVRRSKLLRRGKLGLLAGGVLGAGALAADIMHKPDYSGSDQDDYNN